MKPAPLDPGAGFIVSRPMDQSRISGGALFAILAGAGLFTSFQQNRLAPPQRLLDGAQHFFKLAEMFDDPDSAAGVELGME